MRGKEDLHDVTTWRPTATSNEREGKFLGEPTVFACLEAGLRVCPRSPHNQGKHGRQGEEAAAGQQGAQR